MDFMLCIDTARPLQGAAVVAALEKCARSAEGNGNKLCGAWTTDFGEVDQVVSLWEVEKPHTPDGNLFAPQLDCADKLASRESKLLKLAFPFTRSVEGSHFYDYRSYTVHPGAREKFLAYMEPALVVRRKYSQNIGVWVPATGNADQIIHIWAYRDLAHRATARGGAVTEPAWREYLGNIAPLLQRMQTGLLTPTGFSPLK